MKKLLVGAAMMVAAIGFVNAQQVKQVEKKCAQTECCSQKDTKSCDKKAAQCGKEVKACACKKSEMKKCCSPEAKAAKSCDCKKTQCTKAKSCSKK